MAKQPHGPGVFRTWVDLNTALIKLKTSDEALKMLKAEGRAGNRPTFVRRIFSRYQRLRRKEEFEMLDKQILKSTK